MNIDTFEMKVNAADHTADMAVGLANRLQEALSAIKSMDDNDHMDIAAEISKVIDWINSKGVDQIPFGEHYKNILQHEMLDEAPWK